MKTKEFLPIALTTAANVAVAQLALAAQGKELGEGMGLLTAVFLGFGAAIILFQAAPALFLFISLVRGLFKKPETLPTEEAKAAK